MQKKSIVDNDCHVKYQSHTFKATAPAEITKTGIDYTWLIPEEANIFVQAILKLEGTGFDTYKVLKESLRQYFSDTVLPKASVPR